MEEKRNKNILLIVIIVLLTLMLLMLGYYTFFVKSDDKSINNSNNVKEENNNEQTEKKDNVENADESDIIKEEESSCNKNKNVGIFLFEPTKADLATEAVIAKVEKSLNDLSKKDWQQFVITRALMFSCENDSVNNAKCDEDHFDSGVSTEYSMKCILGVTDEEYKKADIKFFESRFGGSTGYDSYKLADIKTQIKNTYGSYGTIFDKQIDFVSPMLMSNIFYDAKIDKVFIHWYSSISIGKSDRYIVSKTIEKDLYKIEYFEYTVDYDEDVNKLKDSKGNVIVPVKDSDNYKQLVENNIDKFPKKVVTFKLVNGVYKYDSEKDV